MAERGILGLGQLGTFILGDTTPTPPGPTPVPTYNYGWLNNYEGAQWRTAGGIHR